MSADPDSAAYDDLLGAYIRTQRQLAALSQRQLAAMTNVSNAYLSQIERGLHQPSVKVLRSIADALNLSGEALLARAGMATPEQEQAQDATCHRNRNSCRCQAHRTRKNRSCSASTDSSATRTNDDQKYRQTLIPNRR